MNPLRGAPCVGLLCVLMSEGTDAQTDNERLAKQLANPVSSLISVPLQSNVDFGLGSLDATKYTLNVQPVYPMSLTPKSDLIIRTIVPIIYQEELFTGSTSEFGLGDIIQSFFFSPVGTDPIWAVGPVWMIPTGTDALLGTGKWGLGPTALLLKQTGSWTYGFLANHIWSVAGAGDRSDVNLSFVQPFLSRVSKSAVTVTLNTESTYDWIGSQWTVPVHLTVTKVYTFGGQRTSLGGGVRLFAARPDGGPDWGIRFVVTFLFPK